MNQASLTELFSILRYPYMSNRSIVFLHFYVSEYSELIQIQTNLLANMHLHFNNGTHNKNQAIPQQAFLDYFDQLLVYHMYIYIYLEYTK